MSAGGPGLGLVSAEAPKTAQIAVANATVHYDNLYTYTVPVCLAGRVFVGSLVLVPFGQGRARPRLGVVMALDAAPDGLTRLKPLLDAADADARLNEELLAIVRYLKEATFCTWFEAVRAVIPYGAQYKAVQQSGEWRLQRQLERFTQTVYALATHPPSPPRLTAKQRAVLSYLKQGPRSREEICEACGVGAGVAAGLAQKGLLCAAAQDREANLGALYPPEGALPDAKTGPLAWTPVLNAQQQAAYTALAARMRAEKPGCSLLYGVTGSGKTPVFIALIKSALESGKTALVLVPEIGLTPQMLHWMRAAFGPAVAVQHSGLTPTQRLLQWRAIQRGEARVVVGTRSAVFAPLENMGLVVIDEEQERTYQSESAPRYDAAAVARRRAARHGALLLLASATPSVAAFYAAKTGRCGLQVMPSRYGNTPLPQVEMVDMRGEVMDGNPGALSRRLAGAIEEVLADGGQVIVLLNRRGYHRVALCRDCGKAVKCDDCSVPMVYHKKRRGSPSALPPAQIPADEEDSGDGWLQCHYCGKTHSPAPQKCPECGGELRYAGFGTQRLEDELAERLPKARVLRMDMDSTAAKGAHGRMLRQFAQGEYDILLGTQMVAKGLDFEKVRLVGVVGIDSLLFNQGYRAYETVFSLVTQVVGRAGRTGAQGRAIIQTMDPQNPVLNLAARQDYEAFYAEEIGFRKLALYPPFCALCVVGFAAEEDPPALHAARRFAVLLAGFAREAPHLPLRVLGPAPMAVARLAGSYRWRLTLKCKGDAPFRDLLRKTLAACHAEKLCEKVRISFDFHGDG